jgi:glycosyltransferase involved in cell wall biosynthesis
MERQATFTSREVRQFVSRALFDPKVLLSHDPSYPKISVVIPSYNQAVFLERTILSVLNQNYPNTELVIVDGGSSDSSIELIRQYGPYISYWVSEPDKGQPSAINKGFEKATGNLIGWQNSDDVYLPGFFDSIAESLLAYPKAQLVMANAYLIDENDAITFGTRYVPFSVDHLIYLDWNLTSQATFVKRQLIDQTGPLREDIQIGFDWDWFIRVGKLVKYSVLHRAYGGCYRIHPTSKLSRYSHESRWPIEAQILRSHGVDVREDLPYRQQLRWRARVLRLRQIAYEHLLYREEFRYLRPWVLWLLKAHGISCWGFQ